MQNDGQFITAAAAAPRQWRLAVAARDRRDAREGLRCSRPRRRDGGVPLPQLAGRGVPPWPRRGVARDVDSAFDDV